ncbi:MAG: PaaI family thioesterase [Thermodesulfobacteriota bacterium]
MEQKLPYSDWCYVCGKDNPIGFHMIFCAENGRVRGRYTPRKDQQGYLGKTHGGVLCTLLDETMGWAPCLVTGRFYVTAELTVRYLRPFPVGKTMIVEAWPEKVTRRMSTALGEVRDDEGTVYATAHGKFLPISEEETRRVDRMLIYDQDTLRVFERD